MREARSKNVLVLSTKTCLLCGQEFSGLTCIKKIQGSQSVTRINFVQ